MKTLWLTLLAIAATLTAHGQASVMNDTNTFRIHKPEQALFWKSNRLDILAALDLDVSINSGTPNGSGALVHWSQLTGVPSGFADGSDDGSGGGGGGSNFISSVSADFQVLSDALSLTNSTGTGAFVRSSILSGYQSADADLDDLADGSLSGAKVGTGIAGDNVSTGTVADARIAATIARLASPAFTGTPTVPTASAGSSNTVVASTAYVDRAVALGGGGGGGGTSIATNWFVKPSVSGALTTLVPQPIAVATNSTWSPDFSAGRVHRVTMNGNLTLSAPSNVTAEMIGQTFLLILEQDGTGGRSVTPATNYLGGAEITGIGVSTNAGSRSYVTVCVVRTNVCDVLGNLTGYPQ